MRYKVAWNGARHYLACAGVDTFALKDILDLFPSRKSKAISAKPCRFLSTLPREYPHVIGQGLDASEAKSFIADAFPNFLGGDSDILYCLYVFRSEAATSVCDIQSALRF